jgi:hypothetical protein
VPSSNLRDALLVVLLAWFAVTAVEPGAVNALPGFSDHTGPSEIEVASLERLDSGCEDAIADRSRGTASGGNFSKVAFIATDDPDAALSAWTERTSPPGADLSTFRIHVESRASGATQANGSPDGGTNSSCQTGIQYRIEATTSGGSPAGVLPDAHGVRVLWLENGEYAGCSAAYTSPLRGSCHQFAGSNQQDRVWANATET